MNLSEQKIGYEFFFPWRGLPTRANSDPVVLALDETLSGTKEIFTKFPKFEESFYMYEIRARFDNGTGTPVYGTIPKIRISYFNRDPVIQKRRPEAIDCQTSPGEGNQIFLKSLPDFQMQFGEGKKGFEVEITNFGAYTHLGMAFMCRKVYSGEDF